MWVVLMFLNGQKKKTQKSLLKKKMKYSKHEPDSLLCGDITDDQLSAAKRTKTDFIHTRAAAVDEKHLK